MELSNVSDASIKKPNRIDGRRLRSERTKQLIIEAYLVLADAFSPRVPTAAEIAEKAGYSVRSVFERFPDIRALQIAAVDYAMAQVTALAPYGEFEGDRQARLNAQVRARAQVCERWLALWRSLIINQGDSTELKDRIRVARERYMARLEIVYQPELASVSELERRQLVIALEAITDLESWARMRQFFELPFDDACTAWAQAIDRLLPQSSTSA